MTNPAKIMSLGRIILKLKYSYKVDTNFGDGRYGSKSGLPRKIGNGDVEFIFDDGNKVAGTSRD